MLIVVDGCVGVGKTTVARGLALYRGSRTILEAFETNPFLEAFYKDPARNALETEIAFLLLHYHQLKQENNASEESEAIADFHLRKDSLYAQANIPDPRSQKAFSGLYKFLLNHVPAENLTIHLSAPTELLLERIRRRKRYYELTVAENYFVKINAAYEDFYAKFPGRLLRIPMDQWDFVGDPGLYAKLSMLIDEQTGAQGKHVHRWPK